MASEYGVQGDGTFRRKHVDRIREDVKRVFKNRLGEDIELRPNSPLTQIIDAAAVEIARQWQAAEDAYYASFYQDAEGEELDKHLALAGYQRKRLRSATGEVQFSRSDPAPDDITIPEGTVVTTERTETRPRIPFEITADTEIATGETLTTVEVEALKPWQTELGIEWLGEETNVAADTIVRFDSPISGVDAVTNPNPTGDTSLGYTEGRDRETDPEFRLRYENTLAEGGVSTVNGIRASVLNESDDIVSAKVDEVRNSEAGDYGVEVTVLAPGVADDTIGQVIVESRAGGVDSFGSTTVTVQTDDGEPKDESFNRATEADVYVDIDLTTSDTFPDDGQTRIEDKLIRYIGGEASDGITYPGLEIGEDVIFDQVFRRVMEIQGVIEADVYIDTADDPNSQTNIAIATDEAAITDAANIDFL
jgi:uncharacterized phage protein gp47/JayE